MFVRKASYYVKLKKIKVAIKLMKNENFDLNNLVSKKMRKMLKM